MSRSHSSVSCCSELHGQASFSSEKVAQHPFHFTTYRRHPHVITTYTSSPTHTVTLSPQCRAVLYLLIGPTTKDPNCVCISQQRPPRKCIDYVFERGRVQKQLPGWIPPSPLNPPPPPKVSQQSTVGMVKLLGLFLDRELCTPFVF